VKWPGLRICHKGQNKEEFKKNGAVEKYGMRQEDIYLIDLLANLL
jgi:hypothetical protein